MPSFRHLAFPLLVAALVAAPAATAQAAGDVLVVDGERIFQRHDPHLPRDVQPAPPAGPGARAAARPLARPASGPTVRQSLARARRGGHITRAQHAEYWQAYTRAVRAQRRSTAGRRCRAQIGRVLGILNYISRSGALRASRMPALFLQLRRNTEFWTKRPSVRLGERVTFAGNDPLIFQHYQGNGLQIQPLGNFGKANGLWKDCQNPKRRCRVRQLRALLDSMLRIASRRAGSKAWEYWFPFGGGSPPWASGMAQATGMQALARGSRLLKAPRFMRAAQKAVPLFTKPTPAGVRVSSSGGNHYVLYSFDPRLRVLNAHLQTVTGLHDYAKFNRDSRARRLFRLGDRAARREVPRYDTGSWSLYALPNRNASSWEYHTLVTGFLENLCERTGARVYCRTARRFANYSERRGGPPPPGTPGAGRPCGYL